MTMQERIVCEELEQLVEKSRDLREEDFYSIFTIHEVQNISTALNLIEKQERELESKNNIINSAIDEIEKLREYFSEDLQPDFIRILEILKSKKVIDW